VTQPDGSLFSRGLLCPNDSINNVPASVGDTFYVALKFDEKSGNIDQDKGPEPFDVIEIPKVVFSASDKYSGDRSYVLLGKVNCNKKPSEISYADKKCIYDVNNIFAITTPDSDKSYDLSLTGSLVVSQKVQIGDTSSMEKKTDALKVKGGVYTDNLESSGQLKTGGELVAQTATISGNSLSINNGTITAKDITVTDTLKAANLEINSDFSVGKVFTAKQGIKIPTGDLEISSGKVIMDNGSLTMSKGDLDMGQGNLAVNGQLSVTNNINTKDFTVSNSFSAPKAKGEFRGITVTDAITTKNLMVSSSLEVGSLLTAKQGMKLSGNATFNNDLTVNNVTVGGYLKVDENLTVKETLTAKTVAVAQGIKVAENASITGNVTAKSISAETITATGLLQGQKLKLTDTLNSDAAISAQHMTSQTGVVSQSGKVERDFYLYEEWEQDGAQDFIVKPLSSPLQKQSVMYRIVVEGVSDLGIVHSELSGIVDKKNPTKLKAASVNNIGNGASVKQSLNDGNLTISVGQVKGQDFPKQLCFTASIWLFTKSN